MAPTHPNPLVHMELHTDDLQRARTFYAELFGWRTEQVAAGAGSYLALVLGGTVGGGIVECGIQHPLWLPYVEVEEIGEATDQARRLGAAVLLEPREGPKGWRSVTAAPSGAEVALWQPKT